ncbi:MAG: hypothetical protein PHP42_03755 [Bacteroidota bacterium]|nr:hypothetical protein [Bacteroidota bacterium]
MKHLFVLLTLVLMFAGCERSNPVQSSASSSGVSNAAAMNVPFSEQSMVLTTTVADSEVEHMHGDGPGHDSLRNVRLLDSLKAFLGLTNDQVDSIKVYGSTLLETLKNIRKEYKADSISEDSAHALVKIARNQFIASVRSILTTEQKTKFDQWLSQFWDRHHGEGEGHEGGDDHGNGGGGHEGGVGHGNGGGGHEGGVGHGNGGGNGHGNHGGGGEAEHSEKLHD